MPKSTFYRLPAERREPLVREAIAEFADRTYTEASLSQIARRAGIPKGSFYQYFEDKLDLYRWLLTEEAPRQKRAFVGTATQEGDYWARLEAHIERGMAFLVEHPGLARLSAAAADPTAIVEVRGLHRAICEAGVLELRAVVEEGIAEGALSAEVDVATATSLVAAVIGPGLTDVVLHELGAELHEVLASDTLRRRLGPKRRRRLAHQTVLFIRHGLGPDRPSVEEKGALMITHDFSGRVALITGGTSGIGLATALAFARAGARVTVAARGDEAGRRACAALEREGAQALFIQTDVRDEAEVARAVEQTQARFGRLDFAVNSAGAGGDMASLEATDQRVWDDVMAINARGVWLSMRREIPAMLASGGGAIVNMCSIYGVAGRAAHHAYVASKHAVLGMTRSVALEVAPRGIRVNAICAGVTRTPAMQQAEAAFPEVVQQLVAQHPMGRMATESEVVGAALWLCSTGAGFVTGTPLSVDGGFLAA